MSHFLFWVFPRRCAWCGGVTEADCALCPSCEAMGGERPGVPAPAWLYTDDPPTVSCYTYRSRARRQFADLKFNGKRGLAPSIGRTMAEALLASGLAPDPDRLLVCCVPMTEKQRGTRGYNQSLLLAKAVAGHLGAEFAPGLLLKIRETGKQHGLPSRLREENVAGAFAAARAEAARGQAVLLCDDVITTGATLRVCRDALAAAGASEVLCLTFLRTVKR